ncbi:MAG: hydantoinase B/oxoprolinase family protein [Acidobacteria bacterium]|nr:hydantoinase B/oxoprolinase family protein [Acidobacteriota bacterium]MBI3663742.1 hydantoinase B/oxoprolinase family protein [Acidobacteriota bacterium]
MTQSFDPTRLEIFKNLFHSVAEEMGAALRRVAFSPNIKERRDYSCAVFNAAGDVLAMGDHMPVHLGSMPMSVQAAVQALRLDPGDVAVLNDPYEGGTHLPDLTMVMPVYFRGARAPMFYVANRAHHADIGGSQAGSMGLAREVFQEGLRIPPVKIFRKGRVVKDVLALILRNVRTPREREGDLTSQIAACRIGERRLAEMVGKYGRREVETYERHLLDYSARTMRAMLRKIPDGTYRGEDFLDGDGIEPHRLRIAVAIRKRGTRVEVDFTGSAPQCAGSVNAVEAITWSAVFYVFRCLLDEQVPATSGLMRPVRVNAPAGTIVNARPPAAVAGGNVETSQRIVDTLFRALARAVPDRIPAASQGTMNNLTFGGADPRHAPRLRSGQGGAPFAYYETIAGGMGARPGLDGLSGIHTHMTNSLNSPVEVLEHAYPLRVRRYGLRRGSGGRGRWRGGDGVVREIELLADAQVGLLCDRRATAPYGLSGGAPGAKGKNELVVNGKRKRLAAKCSFYAPAGAVVRVETPGGGGLGSLARAPMLSTGGLWVKKISPGRRLESRQSRN